MPLEESHYRLLRLKASPLRRRIKKTAQTYNEALSRLLASEDHESDREKIPPARRALRVQFNVIGALIQREIKTRFGKYKLGYIWALFDPALQIAVWFIVFGLLRNMPATHDMGTILFLATGIIPFLCFRNVAQFVSGAVSGNLSLLKFPLVSQVDTLISRFILEAVTMIIVGLLSFTILINTGNGYYPRDIAGVMINTAGLLFLGFGLGSFNCMAEILWPVYGKIYKVIGRMLYFTSGLFFTMDHIPAAGQKWLIWNPILHGVEGFRTAWSFSYVSPIASYFYLYACGFVLLLIGLLLNHSVRRKLEGE